MALIFCPLLASAQWVINLEKGNKLVERFGASVCISQFNLITHGLSVIVRAFYRLVWVIR